MFKIEKGVSIPPKGVGIRKAEKYPFRDMEVGDSFFVPGAKTLRIASACAGATKFLGNGHKFSVRKVEEKGIAGVRCWRIA